jgi:hypothetical protein
MDTYMNIAKVEATGPGIGTFTPRQYLSERADKFMVIIASEFSGIKLAVPVFTSQGLFSDRADYFINIFENGGLQDLRIYEVDETFY